jgi:DNA-binding PadR family transcriptional regulator
MQNSPDYQPLSEAVFLILVALAAEDLHGYAIMQEVEAISGGRVKFSTGTLYGALKRMLERHWIERIEEPDAHRSRKVYGLTKIGRDLLAAETQRMERIASIAQRHLGKGLA